MANLGGNRERIADARIAINRSRLLVMHAAWLLDQGLSTEALSAVSEIKVEVPNMALDVIDMAIQLHGGAGMTDDFPLAGAWVGARSLRLADGPDEVHRNVIAKIELGKTPMRRVLVTGAASGLGEALTAAFRARGDEVLATDRVAADGIDLVLDITSDADWAAAPRPYEELGRAGRARQQRRRRRWRSDRAVLDGRVALDHRDQPLRGGPRRTDLHADAQGAAVRPHRQRRLARRPRAPGGMGSYNAVKAAVVAFTETCGHELAAYGVHASAVCPSYFRTNLMDSMQGRTRRSATSSAGSWRGRRSRPTTSPRRCWPAWTPART